MERRALAFRGNLAYPSNQLCFSFKLKKFATLLPNNWLAACGAEAWQTIGERERISENN
ncbi:hypothetical protein AB1K18_20810 [Peribacillus simplex]|uniref:hypothetical protein n=1 Tax=Peribacillus simplex TaxID=1478 RepID=UPI003B8E8447